MHFQKKQLRAFKLKQNIEKKAIFVIILIKIIKSSCFINWLLHRNNYYLLFSLLSSADVNQCYEIWIRQDHVESRIFHVYWFSLGSSFFYPKREAANQRDFIRKNSKCKRQWYSYKHKTFYFLQCRSIAISWIIRYCSNNNNRSLYRGKTGRRTFIIDYFF